MQPDVKKLIAAFLGVAILAGVLSFSLLSTGVLKGQNAPQNTVASPFGENAFADIIQVTPPWRTLTASAAPEYIPTSTNMTENLARVMSHEYITAVTVKNGSPDKAVFEKALQKIESQTFQEPEIATSDIKINTTATLQDKLAYMEKVRDTLRSTVQNFAPKNLSAKPDVQNIINLRNLFENKRREAAKMSVPSDYILVQRTLLTFMSGYQMFFDSLAGYEKDPMKALVAMQNKDKRLAGYTTALTDELDKVRLSAKLGYLNQEDPRQNTNLIVFLFSPKVAHADTDPLTLAATIAQTAADAGIAADNVALLTAIKVAEGIDQALAQANRVQTWIQTQLEWLNKLATEQLKNVLVQLFVQFSISWVNGDGAPQFVTNWRSYASDAAQLGIQKGFSGISDDVCGTFGPDTFFQLNNSFSPTNYMPVNCALSSKGRQLENFRRGSFYDGGWQTYGQAVGPEGNYFQNYSNYATRIDASQDAQIRAAINEAVASDSFTPVKSCPPEEQTESAADGSSEQSPAPTAPLPDGTCPDGSEPQITTPGVALGATLEKAFTVPTDRIVNANDLISLAFTLVNGALAKTREAGPSGMTSLGNGASFAVTSVTQTSDVTSLCSSYATGTAGYDSCVSSAGSADAVQNDLIGQIASTSASVDASQAVSNLKAQAQNVFDLKNTLTTVNTATLKLIQDLAIRFLDPLNGASRALLDEVIRTCSNVRVGEAQAAKADLLTLSGLINSVSITVDLDSMSNDLSILSQLTDPAQIRTELDKFTKTYGTVASATQLVALAQSRRIEVRLINDQTKANLPTACTTPIQPITPALLISP
ncbi:MAG: hypothetical protein AAB691_02935 [Patescibacteria group bacterium]